MADIPVSGLFDLDKMKTPDNSDVLLAFHLDSSGRPIEAESGYYTVATLIATLGKIATDAEAGAVSAEEAVEEMKSAVESAISAFNTKITSDNLSWDSNVAADLQSLQTALDNALASIGTSNTTGARGAAIAAINQLYSQIQDFISTSSASINEALQEVESDRQEVAQNKSSVDSTKEQIDTIKGDIDTIYGDIKTRQQDVIEKQTAASGNASDAEEAKTAAVQAKTDALQAKEDAEEAKAAAEKAAADAEATVGQKLTPDRVLVSNADGKFTVSDITTTILSYLSGLTGDVQTQLNDKLVKNATVSVLGAVTGNGSFNNGALQLSLNAGQDIQNMLDEFALSKLRGGMPPAIVFPWFNKNWRPQRTLIANGSVIAETDPEWPTLAAALGISSGAITLPDLVDTIDGGGHGNFICYTSDQTLVGTRVADAIRNILGGGVMAWDGDKTYGVSGAFYPASNSTDALVTNMNGARSRREYFSASKVVPTTTENRPYTIYALPLIAY